MARDESKNLRGVLMRDQTHGDLGAGVAWHNGLAALALITAGQAVNLERRTGGAVLIGRETLLAEQRLHAE